MLREDRCELTPHAAPALPLLHPHLAGVEGVRGRIGYQFLNDRHDALRGGRRESVGMNKITSVQGPVERLDGQLMLLIPLAVGGNELASCARGIGRVDDEFLRVTIPGWLAEKLKINEGTLVAIDNRDGKFNIRPIRADS